jgi:hypothetical protein
MVVEKASGRDSPLRQGAEKSSWILPILIRRRWLSVFWIPGYPGPPAPGPLQRPSFGPGEERRPKPNGEDPHEEAHHEENDG